MNKATILLVDDDQAFIELLAMRLESNNYHTLRAYRATQALKILQSESIDLVITDLKMAHMDGFELFEKIKSDHFAMPVIMMTAHGSIPDAVDAIEQGFLNFISKPIDSQTLLHTIEKALFSTTKPQPSLQSNNYFGISFKSAAMRHVVNHIQALAPNSVNILIQGESGTGKEVTAKAIHQASGYASGPFIAINCAAVPAHLLESELFGHKKGAFTGAINDKTGLILSADNGTILLDEIGDMPLDLQVKLLRVLQERTVRPVGSHTEHKINVRFLSASHKDLQQAIVNKEFREDLYYRLNVVSITLPSLRDRIEDIMLLANQFITELCDQRKSINPQAITHLLNYHWPGNIRQLHNVIEHALVLTPGKLITEEIVLKVLPAQHERHFQGLNEAKKQFEYDYLKKVLSLSEGNVAEAAKLAQRNRSDFYKLLKKHEIN
ncbi:two-component system, NtrC family, response regulator GlrR [Pseudoalteromonas citrea]|uniref:Two-component system, NtrC family, response regulator GlrR n=2 Tax=Pseudoalteromonas citrea TaxID=43655 RepID=A0AAD4AE11_9GAMM|nr:sigma-54 dependent transcriptional regulator [Pseudoalteromonas citrea]KAF7764200.1 two-component system, NtrC family, response regulator GlrR [Pseudoalteromonas citrea]